MHYFLIAKRGMALIAECRHLSDQFPTLAPQHRVDRIFFMVTGEALLCLYRGMRIFLTKKCLVAGGSRAGLRGGVPLRENDQE